MPEYADDEVDLESLYATYLSPTRLTDRIDEVGSQVKVEIEEVMSMIDSAAGSASSYSESLVDMSEKIHQSKDRKGLRTIVESLVHTAKEMEASNIKLEERLNASKRKILDLHAHLEALRSESLTDPLTQLSLRGWRRPVRGVTPSGGVAATGFFALRFDAPSPLQQPCAEQRSVPLGPLSEFIRIIVKPVRQPPIGHHRPLAGLGAIFERLAAFADETRRRCRVGLQINLTVGYEAEHDAAGIKAGAIEHAAHLNGAEDSEQFGDIIGVHAMLAPRRNFAPYSAASLAGVSCTDSPQPQAEVWFGLLKTNWADSFSAL